MCIVQALAIGQIRGPMGGGLCKYTKPPDYPPHCCGHNIKFCLSLGNFLPNLVYVAIVELLPLCGCKQEEDFLRMFTFSHFVPCSVTFANSFLILP